MGGAARGNLLPREYLGSKEGHTGISRGYGKVWLGLGVIMDIGGQLHEGGQSL